jgi:hypothetical protein
MLIKIKKKKTKSNPKISNVEWWDWKGSIKKRTKNTPNKPGKSTKLYEPDHVNEIT